MGKIYVASYDESGAYIDTHKYEYDERGQGVFDPPLRENGVSYYKLDVIEHPLEDPIHKLGIHQFHYSDVNATVYLLAYWLAVLSRKDTDEIIAMLHVVDECAIEDVAEALERWMVNYDSFDSFVVNAGFFYADYFQQVANRDSFDFEQYARDHGEWTDDAEPYIDFTSWGTDIIDNDEQFCSVEWNGVTYLLEVDNDEEMLPEEL